MKKIISLYTSQDKYQINSTIFTFLCILIITLQTAVNYKSLPPKIPLFYSLTWGDIQLASLPQIIILPSIILLITLINTVICLELHTSQTFLKRILTSINALIAFLILVTALKIINIFV